MKATIGRFISPTARRTSRHLVSSGQSRLIAAHAWSGPGLEDADEPGRTRRRQTASRSLETRFHPQRGIGSAIFKNSFRHLEPTTGHPTIFPGASISNGQHDDEVLYMRWPLLQTTSLAVPFSYTDCLI